MNSSNDYYPQEMSTQEHLNFDKNHLWHPYTSLVHPTPVLPVSHAKGCTLYLESDDDDNKINRNEPPALLDGMSSWWAAIWGYQHPVIDQALQHQMQQMSHVMFGGLTHRPATELAAALLSMIHNKTSGNHDDYASKDLSKVFYTDSGSVAVEVALKMAWQYHRGTSSSMNKFKIASVRSGYHGDTLGAMSVCDPVTGMHSAFQKVLPQQVFCQRPPCDNARRLDRNLPGCSGCTCRDGEDAALSAAMRDLEQTISTQHDDLAALILEPIVQGAGGMRFYHPRYLQRARELCTEYNVLLICDEIATGFGRSGGDSPFASLAAGVTPDILCIGKALTGGYMTLGAVITTERVARGVSSTPVTTTRSNDKDDNKVVALPLMHGPTFMANPLACSAALASTKLAMQPFEMDRDDSIPLWKHYVDRIEGELQTHLRAACDLDTVADVRVRGAIGVVELKQPMDNHKVTRRCQELGVWLRPFGKLLYTMPPYVMTNEQVHKVTNAMLILADENR